ncbi:MAG: hypothetical protein HY718_15305, partial [Planctomycetes bacterium]|nr:hypothetical protein [Planctomycetota bacterium]
MRGSYLYWGDGDYFVITNLSNERQPVEVSRIRLWPHFIGGIVLRGDLAYVGCWGGTVTFFVYDISNPLSPVQVGQFVDVVETNALFLMGNYAFIAGGGGGLVTANISDPTQPTVVTRTDVPLWPGTNNAWESAVTGNGRWLFLGAGENYPKTPTQDNYTRGGIFSLEVFNHDVDDTGPSSWSRCSLGEAAWDTQYDGDLLPTAASPAWKVLNGSESWASASGGVLRINDTGTATNDRIRWWRNWDATNVRGATVLVRARCDSVQQSGTINNLTLEDGRYVEDFAILPDRIRANRSNLNYLLDGTQWHTYRITTQGTQFKVYMDESANPAITGPLSSGTQRARVIFGADSGASRQDLSFDFITCASEGPQTPPPAVLGSTVNVSLDVRETAGKGSLSGLNPDTATFHWSNDGGATWSRGGGSLWDCRYEADAMPEASATVPRWEVFEGLTSLAQAAGGILQIDDNSTVSGSKIKWMRSWGAVPSIGTTMLARVRCTAIGGDTTFLGNLFVEDGLHVEQFKIMTDRIVAANAGLTYMLDGTAWHVYRITTRDNEFKVYVDEAPAPVLTGALASPSSINRVMFGSGASAGTQVIEFDYVYYGTMGDQAPGTLPPSSPVQVTCSAGMGAERGTVTAYGMPLAPRSDLLNRFRFSLRDLAGNTGFSPVYIIRVHGRIPDYDNDNDVDQEDFGAFQACLAGQGTPPLPGCQPMDLDDDQDVDQDDLEILVPCLSAPGAPS